MAVLKGRQTMREIAKGLKDGYVFQQVGSGHYAVIGPDGEQVREPSGCPVRVPFSPRPSSRDRIRRDLERAGVMKPRDGKGGGVKDTDGG